jgi:diguanylate cyclase (GGDEF)-like protein
MSRGIKKMTRDIIREEINQRMKRTQPSTKNLSRGRFSDAQCFGVTLLTGIVLSVMAATMVWQSERDRLRNKYEAGTKKVAIALQKAINADLNVFEEVKAFYIASQAVEETEFQLFVQSSMSQHPCVDMVAWIPSLPATQSPPTLNPANPDSDLARPPGNHLVSTQAGDRQPSLPVKYLASRFHPELNIGFDFAQESSLPYFQEAKDTGEIILFNPMDAIASSDKFTPDQPLKIWAISAIYQNSLNYSTVELRHQNLKGFLIANFNLTNILPNILTNIFAEVTPGIESDEWEILRTSNLVISLANHPHHSPFDLSYLGKSNQQALTIAIYEAQTGLWTKNLSSDPDLNLIQSLCPQPNGCILPLQIGNQQWSLQFLPTAAYIKTQTQSKAWLTLIFGLSITGIVSAYLPRFLCRYRQLEKYQFLSRQMQQKLRELRREKHDLKTLLKTTTEHADSIKTELKLFLEKQGKAYHELEQANLELRTINSEVMLLGKMSNLLQACLTEKEAQATISEFMGQLFPNHSGAIYRICESIDMVELLVSWGKNPPIEFVFPIHDCWSLRSGRSHLFDRQHNDLPCQHYHASSTEQSLCIPLMAQGETFGLLYLTSNSLSNKLTAAKQKLALAVAEHTGLALANLKLRETLRLQSIRDALTGLYNRRYLEEYLATETHRCQRSGKSFGVVMIDVDHFKNFNDTFGHETGDMVLQELAKFLQNNVRSSDVVCRYGGEELTLILSEVSLEDTEKIAEKIRLGVKQLSLKSHHQSVGAITISLGVAIFPQDGWTCDRLLESADQALYRAKREGRDRVSVAEQSRVVTASEPEKSPPLLKVLS